MFGYVTASGKELSAEEKKRYSAVYCGICRAIKERSSGLCRLSLSYDMAFLALLLMSLYEPEEASGKNHCFCHPVGGRNWINNEYIGYAADMNVILAYYNCLDDWRDDGKRLAKAASDILGKHHSRILAEYPRQCRAVEECIGELSRLEKAGCSNPDEPANSFGKLMGELLVYREDFWSSILRDMGHHLGRFIYLADGAVDYRSDKKKNKYNPYLAMGSGEDWARWEEYLVQAMGRCTLEFEKLPLVQDKALLDNILYSGVWMNYRGKGAKVREET